MSGTLVVKVKTGKAELSYHNKVNAENFKEIALVLFDLEENGLPIEKAIVEFKNLKKKEFPW